MFKFVVGVCLIIAAVAVLIVADSYSHSLLTAEEKAAYRMEQIAIAEQNAAADAERKERQQRLNSTPYSDVRSGEFAEWFALHFNVYAMWFGLLIGFIFAAKVFANMTKTTDQC